MNKVRKIFKTKKAFHKKRAKMTFESKIKQLVKLQKLANDIRTATKRVKKRIWEI